MEQKEFLLRSNTETAPQEDNQDYWHAHGAFEGLLQTQEDTARNFSIKRISLIFQVQLADFELFSLNFHFDCFPFVLEEYAKIQSQTRNFILVQTMSKKANMLI